MDLWAWMVDNGNGDESLAVLPMEPGRPPLALVAPSRQHLEVFTDAMQEHAASLGREFRLRRYVPAGNPVTTVSPPSRARDAAAPDIPDLGEMTFGRYIERGLAAGLTVSYHDMLPADAADGLAAAQRDGRLVARLRLREDTDPFGDRVLVLRPMPPHAADVARQLVIAERRALRGDADAPALVQQLTLALMEALDVDVE